MLRSIYATLFGPSRTDRQALRRNRPRRLVMENLESRNLLTATLTLNSISDSSFAAPTLAARSYQVDPSSSVWQYVGDAGVSANNSDFTSGNPAAPNGTQVGFIKDNSSISQTVYLQGGVYNLSLLAAQRAIYQTQPEEIEILVDGANVGLIMPAGTAYTASQSANFTVFTGTHTVELLGLNPSVADSTVFISEIAIAPVVDGLLDGNFTQPTLAAATYVTDPTGLPWQFSGTAGVAANSSSFLSTATVSQNAPSGTQVGYLQDTGGISQTVYLDTGVYQVSFLAAQRAINQTSYQEIEVVVDGVNEGMIDPVGTTYSAYQSSAFSVAAGAHTILLVGANPQGGDNTALIDQVSLIAANGVSDGSFETPALDAAQYVYAPGGAPWTFSSGAGISSNGSTFTTGSPNAPDGSQVAFINGAGAISQTAYLAAGSYNISFQAAQSPGNTVSQGEEIQVVVDGAQVGLLTPVGTSYSLYDASNFMLAAGMHTLQLVGLNPQGGTNMVLIDEVALATSQDTVIDGGFEAPVLPANTYTVAPSGATWQFLGLAGISNNNSGITSGNPGAPQGAQVAFIMDNGGMSYADYLDAGSYSLSFLAAQRAKYQTQSESIEVLVDNSVVSVITPASTSYTTYQTVNFSVAAGMHTIELAGLSPATASSVAFVDQVSLTATRNTLSDGGFETPALPAGTYGIAPSGSGWQFAGLAGVSANNSGFTAGNPGAPGGAQVGLIKDNGSMCQSVYFTAGTYCISLLAAERLNYQTQGENIAVLIDGAVIGAITPQGTKYLTYQSPNFSVATGTHTVKFLGLSPATADSTLFIDNATIVAGGGIINGSFESPALAARTYLAAPATAGWQFFGDSGISANNSAFTSGNPAAPDGSQVAFLKSTASISQSVYLGGGMYDLSFMAAQRGNMKNQNEEIEVLVDGRVVGTVTPAGTTYGSYQTSMFTVLSGMHTIQFLGVDPSGADETAFIDNAQLS
jgi:hypothetical protein